MFLNREEKKNTFEIEKHESTILASFGLITTDSTVDFDSA